MSGENQSVDGAGRFLAERRYARRCALQYLYQSDAKADWGNVARNLGLLRDQAEELCELPHRAQFRRAWEYTEVLAKGVASARGEIDELITGAATNWRLDRMSVIDRNILRLAIFELYFREDIPKLSAIDEAVELAKEFGDKDSGRFVNGVLDHILQNLREERSDSK